MNLKLICVTALMSGSAFAAGTHAPAAKPMAESNRATIAEPKLTCPTGTRQAGGQNSKMEASFCMRLDDKGAPVSHGPYLSLHATGKKAVEGQYENGKRQGLWTTWDENGQKVEEVTFVDGQYHGARTQWVNGVKTVEEHYSMGKLTPVTK
jgi:hypothetical protein